MRSYQYLKLVACICILSACAFAGTAFKATTKLTVETSNNTSAANSFADQPNGNVGASNISKLPVRNLLYAGANTKVYVHVMPWFGFGDHMAVGYASNDPVQVQRQVNDMISRGLDGAIIDWFGQGKFNPKFVFYNQATQDWKNEVQLHTNFQFAIMDDAGSLKTCAATLGCDVTQTLIDDLTYAYNNYETSPSYLHFNNQPVVYFFGHEAYTIDWTRVRTSVPGNPLFIFRNTGGFGYAESNGAFSWVAPETVSATDPMALVYVDNFDKAVLTHTTAYTTESGYKGFNDTLAAWTSNRIMSQQCGQTWLKSMSEGSKFFSATKQMPSIQLVTWNDYEEATELESGIDNCVTVSASSKGTVASWAVTGQLNTIDHFSVFISQDGENLMWLADAAATATSLDLAQFSLTPGGYTLFVKAVGKPMLTNKMSAGASLVIPDAPPPPPPPAPPTFALASSGSTTATIARGQTATYNLSITPANGFSGTIALACNGAPAGTSCTITPSSVVLTNGVASAPLTVSVAASQQARLVPVRLQNWTLTFASVFVVSLGGIKRKTVGKRAARYGTLLVLTMLLVFGVSGCGGGSASAAASQPVQVTPTSAPTQASLTVIGTSGAQSTSISLGLTITH